MIKKSVIVLLFIIVYANSMYSVTDNTKAMGLINKGYEAFQIYKDPNKALTFYTQAIDLASGYVKATALLRAAYMSHLIGVNFTNYQDLIKRAFDIDPEMKLGPADYKDSFINIVNEIKNSAIIITESANATPVQPKPKPVVAKPAPEPVAAQPEVTRPVSLPVSPKPKLVRKSENVESKANIFTDLGFALIDFKGIFFEGGIQYSFSPSFWGEFLVEYYIDPANISGIDTSSFGLNFNVVGKFNSSKKVSFFLKGGVCLMISSFSFFGISDSSTDFGLNAGAGLELPLGDSIGLRAGTTFKCIFGSGGVVTALKFFGGFYFSF